MELEIRVPMLNRESVNSITMKRVLSTTTVTIPTTTTEPNCIDDDDERNIKQPPPCHSDDDDDDEDHHHDDNDESYFVLYVSQSRILWYGLLPLLYDSSSNLSFHAVRYILNHHFSGCCFDENIREIRRPKILSSIVVDSTTGSSSLSFRNDCRNVSTMQMVRSFTVTNSTDDTTTGSTVRQLKPMMMSRQSKPKKKTKIVLYIQPPTMTRLEYTNNNHWMRYLLHNEQLHIQAQSILGYISTIGGGYFLCHHFRTAILLALYQQRIAILLNDRPLYYTTFIHMAYSYIYNGQFDTANGLLQRATREINAILDQHSTSSTVTTMAPFVVLQNMCRSAQLFRRRMRRYARSAGTTKSRAAATTTLIATKLIHSCDDQQSYHNNITCSGASVSTSIHTKHTTGSSISSKNTNIKTIDNYQRIRIVPDQSKPDDFEVPFSKRSIEIG